jgi:salicylate hydroxylase
LELTLLQNVRQFAFPEHKITYTGTTSYRTVVPESEVQKINGLPDAVIFWHGTDSKWVYTCPLSGGDWEVTCAVRDPVPMGTERASWGRSARLEDFRAAYADMCPPIQEILSLATYVDQFDFCAGPRLDSVVVPDIALIGDGSHPLSGAFGGGAGFVLEDAYVLAQSVKWATESGGKLEDALELYDEVRSPHYAALYAELASFKAAHDEAATAGLEPDEEIRFIIDRNWRSPTWWMLKYQVRAENFTSSCC